MIYRLKPLPVEVFTWAGQDPVTWPEWTRAKILGVLMVPGWAANLAIKNGESAWIMPQGESLVLYPDGSIRGFKAAELALEVEYVEVTPSPSPTPTPAYPQQPYEPVTHRDVNGVDNVVYYATPKGGPEHLMPLSEWQALNPQVTTGLH